MISDAPRSKARSSGCSIADVSTITGSSAERSILSHAIEKFKSVHPRHPEIEQDNVRALFIQTIQRGLAVDRDPKPIPRSRQKLPYQVMGHLLVIHQQHLRERVPPRHPVQNLDQSFAIDRLGEVLIGAQMRGLARLAGGGCDDQRDVGVGILAAHSSSSRQLSSPSSMMSSRIAIGSVSTA